MQRIINGGIYAIDLQGEECYEFKETHPAMVVRTLKEKQVYYVVPLTTYSQERWEKCRKKGFGTRIYSTNSIARVDKIKIVSVEQLKSRYYNRGRLLVAKNSEVRAVLSRVEEYIALSNIKACKEYEKYETQCKRFEEEVEKFLGEKQILKFPYALNKGERLELVYPNRELTCMHNSDIENCIKQYITTESVTVSKRELNVNISISE